MRLPVVHSLYKLLILMVVISTLSCTVRKSTTNHFKSNHATDSIEEAAALDTSVHAKLQQPPEGIEIRRGTVFLESVNKIVRPDTAFLLVKGNFPNSCTRLQYISHTIENNTLTLELGAWQPENKMCTQVLTPFSYLYKQISKESIRNLRSYMHEGERKSFQ